MAKGGSQSSSSTSTANYDQRVASEDGVALGKDAILIVNEEFSDNVAKGFKDLVDFASRALETAEDTQKQSVELGEKALDAANKSGQGAVEAIGKSSDRALEVVATITKGAGDIIGEALKTIKTSGQTALQTVAQNQQEQAKGPASVYTDLFPYLVVAAVVLVAIAIFGRKK